MIDFIAQDHLDKVTKAVLEINEILGIINERASNQAEWLEDLQKRIEALENANQKNS